VLRHLRQDASQLMLSDDGFRDVPALSSSDRNREAVRGVFHLDDAFVSVLELLKETLHPYTAALYWSEGSGGSDSGVEGFRLREIISEDEGIYPDKSIRPGEGLLGLVIQQKKILNLSLQRNLDQNIPYYHHRGVSIRSLAAAPVMEGERCMGLLVVDSKEQGAFRGEDEKALERFAEQVREVYDHALLFQKARIEARKFKGLTELSHLLNTTLDMNEILDIILRATAPILNYDLAAISLWDEDGQNQVIAAADGNGAEELKGNSFGLEGSLAGWVIAEKKYLSMGRLRDRDRKTPVFSGSRDLKERSHLAFAQSLLAYPFLLYDEALGAIFFLGERVQAFSSYDVQVTGLIADLSASAIANARLYQEMEKRAVTDGLTGLYNHRYFQESLRDEVERAERRPGPFSVVLFDLDHFKAINDRFGHPMGDRVLKSVAKLIRDSIRKIDLAARYGGEEFVIMLVNTDAGGAFRLAERIRKAASRMVFNAAGPGGSFGAKASRGEEFYITLSAGIAAYPEQGLRAKELVEAADKALYQAKEAGRNRAVVFKPSAKLKEAAGP
jgi:two-component system cell cycle response regulator